MTPRRFWALVTGLPLEGAFAAHLRAEALTERDATGREAPPWRAYFGRTPLWELVADLFDLTHQVAAGKKRIAPYPRHPKPQQRVLAIDELTDDMWE